MAKFFWIIILVACSSPADRPASADGAPARDYISFYQQSIAHLVDSLCTLLPGWLEQNDFNPNIVLLADLGMHSGLPRMLLVDVTGKTVLDSGLVAHGMGSLPFAPTAQFSNQPNSYCSSEGKYRIGKANQGNFGLAYKLHGLESTNNQAFNRFVVLHAYQCVPDSSVYPAYLCNSQGCPMVSHGFLRRISRYIEASPQPMLLWLLR